MTEPSDIPVLYAPKIIIMGPTGTGKTHSIGTMVDSGIETFYLALENGLESLIGYWSDRGKPIPENLHWHRMQPTKVGFKEMAAAALRVNTLALETLAKGIDMNRHLHNQMVRIWEVMNDFPCDRTGKRYGDVGDWDTSRAIVIDGLTGLSRGAMSLVIGGKPVKSQPDYQLAMNQIENFLRMVCDDCPCWFVLIAHDEPERDESLGTVKRMVSTLGRKLAPIIPPMFSDVVLSVREGTKWTWDTTTSQADTKARNLPWAAGITPDFKQIVAKWKSRVAAAGPHGPGAG